MAMTNEEHDFVAFWADRLPPVIARKNVDWFLGGVVSPAALRQADCRGAGPDNPFRVGRHVAYNTVDLLSWLVQTRGLQVMQNLKNIKGRSNPVQTQAAG